MGEKNIRDEIVHLFHVAKDNWKGAVACVVIIFIIGLIVGVAGSTM